MKHRYAPGEDIHRGAGDQRRYFRVRARIPVRHRLLQPGEFESLALEIETPQAQPEVGDPATSAQLARLEEKLDEILVLLNGAEPPAPVESVDVEISGGGIRFAAKIPEDQVGGDVLIELLLPGQTPRRVRAIGRVMDRREGATIDQIAVAFRVIDERDREAVVRFAHEVERAHLRTRAARERGE